MCGLGRIPHKTTDRSCYVRRKTDKTALIIDAPICQSHNSMMTPSATSGQAENQQMLMTMGDACTGVLVGRQCRRAPKIAIQLSGRRMDSGSSWFAKRKEIVCRHTVSPPYQSYPDAVAGRHSSRKAHTNGKRELKPWSYSDTTKGFERKIVGNTRRFRFHSW